MENNFVMEESASGRTTYYQSNTGNINIDNTSGYRWHYTFYHAGTFFRNDIYCGDVK